MTTVKMQGKDSAPAAAPSVRELVWSGALTVQRGRQLKQELTEALAAAEQVRLQLVDVSEVDVAFLQLLCAAHRSASRAHKRLSLAGELPLLAEITRLAGFHRHVGCSHDLDESCLWQDITGRSR